LTELYHEAAAAVIRQLWEVSLNLHWMMADPQDRADLFVNFTTMEARKLFQISDNLGSLDSFDEATKSFQARFRTRGRDGNASERVHTNFSTKNVRDRAIELGDPWDKDYQIVYHLTSMHAHGAPGAVLHAVFQNQYGDVDVRERDQAAILAIFGVHIIKRNLNLLADAGIIPDKSSAEKAFQDFMAIVKPPVQKTDD
jgi:hypothetical protein